MHDENTRSSTRGRTTKNPRSRRKLHIGLALVVGVAATAAFLPAVGPRGLEIRDAAAILCTHVNGNFAWSCAGPIAGWSCTQILETADPHTWSDNYFCAFNDIGARWSSAGPIGGMRCTRILELADPHTWGDNYLCVPTSSPYYFQWSMAGALPGMNCVQWDEPADPDTWNDNYLCWY